MLFRRLLVVAALLVMVGCSNTNKDTPKEVARRHWNAARAGVLFNLAKSQFEKGNLDACRKTVNEAATLDPENINIRILSARLAIEQGQLETAERELQFCKQLLTPPVEDKKAKAAPMPPQQAAALAEVLYYSGVINQRWQRMPAALECYVKASELAPGELPYLLARAETLVAVNEHAEALSLLKEKLVYFENSPAIRDAVGELLVQDGKFDEGAVLLRQASILAPDEMQIREHLGLALYYAKNYVEAAAVIERLLKNESYSQRGDLMLVLGECQLQTEHPREARESFQVAAQLQPGQIGVWLGLAKSALKLDDPQRVELSVRKAMSLDANSAEAHLLLGYLRLKQGKLDESLSAFRKASALNSQDPVSLCMVGYVLEKKGRSAEAIGWYGKALKVKPDDELASTLMAQVRAEE